MAFVNQKINSILRNKKGDISGDVSRDFLGIPFPAGDFRAGAQKGLIVNFEE